VAASGVPVEASVVWIVLVSEMAELSVLERTTLTPLDWIDIAAVVVFVVAFHSHAVVVAVEPVVLVVVVVELVVAFHSHFAVVVVVEPVVLVVVVAVVV
jgi:hypothetical protein